MVANPFWLARRELRQRLGEFFHELTGDVLDIGCGTQPYRDQIPARRYVGLEVDAPEARERGVADVFYDGKRFPFPDGSFDGALCSQVLEHVFTPRDFLLEIHRVLKRDGKLVLSVPFVWDEHEQPRDFGRYSSFGLRAMLMEAGFDVLAHRKCLADARAIFQLWNAYLYKITRTRSRMLNAFSTFALMSPVNILGATVGRLLPGNEDLFLDNVVLAQKCR